MAIVRIPETNRTIRDHGEIASYLVGLGIDYEIWEPSHPTPADASAEEILNAYATEIDRLKRQGGYVTADVINVGPETPNLDAMLEKFSREHWHNEDEVRFIIHGRGIFHIHPSDGPVVAIEVESGDLIRVPRGVHHWFNLCGDRTIRAIRLFQDPSGWTPVYTGADIHARFEPLCLGSAYLNATL
jgi:1,2-dihydroxy-3-keto-5-methylthiopentene dioxygenase